MRAIRFASNPLLTPQSPGADERLADNINGPSLIRVPPWLNSPLGRYYLYFAHHQGRCIRLAYADTLQGPWRVHTQGTLQLEQTPFVNHIASPDVHVDDTGQQIVMYFHGVTAEPDRDAEQPRFAAQGHPFGSVQTTRVATSPDGLNFTTQPQIICPSYLRVFRWAGWTYGLAMPGFFYRSPDGFTDWRDGPRLFSDDMRHCAVRLERHRDGGPHGEWADTLRVFYTDVGDNPERIYHAAIDLTGHDWESWQVHSRELLLEPEEAYEGANCPAVPSRRGSVHEPVRQLRDPAVYEEDGRLYLFYSIAGEAGIAGAEIEAAPVGRPA